MPSSGLWWWLLLLATFNSSSHIKWRKPTTATATKSNNNRVQQEMMVEGDDKSQPPPPQLSQASPSPKNDSTVSTSQKHTSPNGIKSSPTNSTDYVKQTRRRLSDSSPPSPSPPSPSSPSPPSPSPSSTSPSSPSPPPPPFPSLSASNNFTATAPHRSVWAIGDLHGDLFNCLMALHAAAVVDADGRWSAGSGVLVQTGDVLDRGPDGRKLYDFFFRLRREAQLMGGDVVMLLGNHDIMNLCGDFRYADGEETQQEFGGVEGRMAAFSEQGLYGRLLRSFPVVVEINKIVYVHAGMLPEHAQLGYSTLNKRAKEELQDWCVGSMSESAVLGNNGVVWTRRLSTVGGEECDIVTATLQLLGGERMVIGHTVQETGNIQVKCDGKLILIDTGVSRYVMNKPTLLQIDTTIVSSTTNTNNDSTTTTTSDDASSATTNGGVATQKQTTRFTEVKSTLRQNADGAYAVVRADRLLWESVTTASVLPTVPPPVVATVVAPVVPPVVPPVVAPVVESVVESVVAPVVGAEDGVEGSEGEGRRRGEEGDKKEEAEVLEGRMRLWWWWSHSLVAVLLLLLWWSVRRWMKRPTVSKSV
eukprot:GHVS01012194.1.p1 GENE.GHVS01012194.1~~GHVS01012194.1.p1  ORF type:complete len:588 (+),score=203.26 GHVS01012194.1:71-1834(+)